MKLCADQLCDRKNQLLPLTEFNVNRNRADGRCLYCRTCMVRRQRDRANRMKEQAEARARSEVLNAIHAGSRTREIIRGVTGLHEDVISEVVAELWDRNEIKIKDAQYYPRAA